MAEAKSGHIVNVMREERLFPPPQEFSERARIRSMEEYQKLWDEAAADPGSSGATWQGGLPGSNLLTRHWSGISRLPGGSPAA